MILLSVKPNIGNSLLLLPLKNAEFSSPNFGVFCQICFESADFFSPRKPGLGSLAYDSKFRNVPLQVPECPLLLKSRGKTLKT